MNRIGLIILFLLINIHLLLAQSRRTLEKERTAVTTQIRKLENQSKKIQNSILTSKKSLKILEEAFSVQDSFYRYYYNLGDSIIKLQHRKLLVIEDLEKDITRLKAFHIALIRIYYHSKLDHKQLVQRVAYNPDNRFLKIEAMLLKNQKYLRLLFDLRLKLCDQTDRISFQLINADSLQQRHTFLRDSITQEKRYQQKILNQNIDERLKIEQKIDASKTQYQKLSKRIEKAIREEELAARNKARKPKPKPKVRNIPKEENSDFAQMKGRLPMPVKGGSVVATFGKKVHPEFNHLYTQNNGIDIQASKASEIQAVHKGEVVSVFSIPGMNTAVMLKHGAYFTTYANLENVKIKKGQILEKGQSLGIIGKSGSGANYLLHFEIWKGKNKENPMRWIGS